MVVLSFLAALLHQSVDADTDRGKRIAKLVEEIRGGSFSSPVPLREGTRRECASVSLETARMIYGEDSTGCEKALKVLGLIPSSLRIDVVIPAATLAVNIYATNGEIALLDLKTPDDEIVYWFAVTLADQRFDLPQAAKKLGSFDERMAFAAMRQGDADMTKRLYWAGRKRDELLDESHLSSLIANAEKCERDRGGLANWVVPRLFTRSSDFPWRRGGIFMESIRKKGGMAAVDQVYTTPPVCTEHILHPEKYLSGEKPVAIDAAPLEAALTEKGYTRSWSSTLGEFGMAIVMETHFKEDMCSVAPGWGGDLLLHYEDAKGRPLLVWASTWDTEADAIEFLAACYKLVRALPSDKKANNLALRKGTSVAFFVNMPTAIQDDLLSATWKCTKHTGDKTEPFGQDD